MSFDSYKSKFSKFVDDRKEDLGIQKKPPPSSNPPPHHVPAQQQQQQQQQPAQYGYNSNQTQQQSSQTQYGYNGNQSQQQPAQYGYNSKQSQQQPAQYGYSSNINNQQNGSNNGVSLNKTVPAQTNQPIQPIQPNQPNQPIRKFAPPTPTGQVNSDSGINLQKQQPSQINNSQQPPIPSHQQFKPIAPQRPAPPPANNSSNINLQKQPSQTNVGISPQRPVSHQQIQYQPSVQQPNQNNTVSLEKRTTPSTNNYSSSSPSPSYTYNNNNNQQQQQQQMDGASTITLEKKSSIDVEQLPESLKKHTEYAKTNTNIALTSIGVPIDQIIKAKLPPLYLSDPMYLANIQYTEIILEIENVSIKPINYGEKMEPLLKHEKLIIYKTLIDDTIIIQLGHIYIYTNIKEKPSFRAYPFHYIISDNFNNFFMLKIDKHANEESVNKLEVILTYYTTYYRVPPKKEEYTDATAKKMENASGKVEKASLSISKGLVTGGTYFAKGAAKVGEVYKNNTKKYDGPELTEEQRREIEDPNSKMNKEGKGTEKMAQGTASVQKGIAQGFGFIGSKISQGVHNTDWYKEREAKKKEEERLYGKNQKKEAGSGMASTGVGALKNIWGGLEEGVLISARGVRDASVDAKKHTSGEYEAEKSRRKWDSAGNATISVVNIVSLLSVTWIKGALYIGAGAISYNVDQVSLFSVPNAYWKAGWLTTRSNLLAGSNWSPRWVVLRNSTLALYATPNDPPAKPILYVYLNKIRGVTVIPIERSHRKFCFDVVTTDGAISLSALTENIDYSDESIKPIPDEEVMQWTNSILSVSTFIGDLKDPNNK